MDDTSTSVERSAEISTAQRDTLNGPTVEMDEVNPKSGNRDWVVPVCINGMKQVNVGNVLTQHEKDGTHRDGGTG